jgi:dynamin 1-like protein
VSNLTTAQNGTDTPLTNHINSVPENVRSDNELRSVLSPVKPVNLLPQVPINSNSYRKLSENEEHDCEIIGDSSPTD